jgi:hypothetical protein
MDDENGGGGSVADGDGSAPVVRFETGLELTI